MIYANNSLANTGNPGYIYTSGLIYSQANLSNDLHILSVDNDQGAGFLGLDYVEVISITGGTPFNGMTIPPPTISSTAKYNNVPIGKIVGPIVGIGIPLLIFLILFFVSCLRRRSDPFHRKNNDPMTPFVPAVTTTPLTSNKIRTTVTMNPVASLSNHGTRASWSSLLTSRSSDLYTTLGRGRYVNEKCPHVANVPLTPETPGSETPDQRLQAVRREL
jgi:hypothetical protein